MTNALKTIDDVLDPLLQAANRVRQVRDALPQYLWQVVPPQLRLPMDQLFLCVENWDRFVGQQRELGNLPPKIQPLSPEMEAERNRSMGGYGN